MTRISAGGSPKLIRTSYGRGDKVRRLCRWPTLFFVLLPAVLLAALLAVDRPAQDLLQPSYRLADYHGGRWLWFDHKRALVLLPDRDDGSWQAARLVTAVSGSATPISTSLGATCCGSSPADVSRDGRWFLGEGEDLDNVLTCSLSRPVIQNRANVPMSGTDAWGLYDLRWCPDCDHWIELYRDHNTGHGVSFLRSRTKPRELTALPFNHRAAQYDDWKPLSDRDIRCLEPVTWDSPPSALLPRGDGMQVYFPGPERADERLLVLDVHLGAWAVERTLGEVPLGPGDSVVADSLSPDAGSAAVLVQRHGPTGVARWVMCHYAPLSRLYRPGNYAIMVYTPATRAYRCVGTLPYDNDDAPTDLRWVPDGRSVTFVYQGASWCVPTGQ